MTTWDQNWAAVVAKGLDDEAAVLKIVGEGYESRADIRSASDEALETAVTCLTARLKIVAREQKRRND